MPTNSSNDRGLTASDVSFSYGRARVLHDFTAEFGVGATALVGPNGSGKSTLLRVLAGTTGPKTGHLDFRGERVSGPRRRSGYRAHVGYMPQEPEWIGEFTVREFLAYFAYLRCGRGPATEARIDLALERLDLEDLQRSQLRRLSGGQRRRTFLGQAIVHEPPVLILDEPTVGLDPVQRAHFRRYLNAVAEDRIAIVATHLVEDVKHLADSIQVLHEGHQVWAGTPDLLEEIGAAHRSQDMSDIESGVLRVLGTDTGEESR